VKAGLKLTLFALAIGAFVAACLWYGKREANERRLDAYARGYAQGLAEGVATGATVPADPDIRCHVRLEQLEDELDAAATCEARLLDHQRTAAAGRASARLLGWNDGYGVGREDWRAQPWECRAAAAP
jgi:flagellar biosynthesis/type III secretory pathway protein FliH